MLEIVLDGLENSGNLVSKYAVCFAFVILSCETRGVVVPDVGTTKTDG